MKKLLSKFSIAFITSHLNHITFLPKTMAEVMKNLVYQEPSSIYTTIISLLPFSGLVLFAILELFGKPLQYSKFWNVGSFKSRDSVLSSRTGMLVFYTPALLVGVLSFVFFPNDDFRFLVLKSAMTIQFLKRDLEVLFLHNFSGFIVLDSAIVVSLLYFTGAAGMVYFQHTTRGFPGPLFDLKYTGVFLFVVGFIGNLYHHYLLSKLREKSDKGYKIPRGGLFGLVICPHYLFEIIMFMGISLISQTLFSYSCAFGSALYLAGRSYSTRRWYLSKFENFPRNVKCLVPFVF